MPKLSPPSLFSGTPEILMPLRAVDDARRLVLPAVDRGDRGHDLEGRARRVARLRDAVEERRARRGVEPRRLPRAAQRVRVVAGDGRHHLDAARCAGRARRPRRAARRAGRARPAARPGRARCAGRRPGGACPAAGAARSAAPSERPGELAVVEALEPGGAGVQVRVADRVGEQPAQRVAARVRAVRAAHRARERLVVGGEDAAAVDPLLRDQRALVLRVVLERRRARRPSSAT